MAGAKGERGSVGVSVVFRGSVRNSESARWVKGYQGL